VHAFDVLGDPVRRRLVELLAAQDAPAGAVSRVVEREFGISQPAVAKHLRVLREAGFVAVRQDGPRRIYRLEPAVVDQLEEQVARYRALWSQRLDALETEIARGRRHRKETER
jgi:DNA-binding transcriptional ArsR family regulator